MPVSHSKSLTIVAAIGVAGILVMLFATRFGIGIDPDSTVYLDAARNLLHGKGLSVLSERSGQLVPLTHYPPLYSSLLALISVAGISLEHAARILNAILFGANIFLIGFAISLCTRHSFWLPVLGASLALTSVDVAGVHSIALTEPLFIFFTLIGLGALTLYLDVQKRRFLIAAALALACSLLTRYVGVASLVAGFLVLVTFRRSSPGIANILPASNGEAADARGRDLRRALFDGLFFGAIASLPMFLWTLRNHFAANVVTDRQFVFHPVKLGQLVSGVSTSAQWLLLGKVPAGIRAIGFVIQFVMLAGLGIYLMRRRPAPEIQPNESVSVVLPRVLMVFIAVYILFLIFTASFIDADTVFDSRSLLPLHVAGIILVVCIFSKRFKISATLSATLVLFAALLVASHSFRFVSWVVRTNKDGQGYASRTWTESDTIAALKPLASEVPIYSNGSDAIHYLTGRPGLLIPEKISHGTGFPNLNYDREVEAMKKEIMDRNGVLVYLHNLPERSYLPSEDELSSRLSPQVRSFSDGSIFETTRK